MLFDEINSDNYLIFAADNYCRDSTGQTIDDFYDDMARFTYINRALNKYNKHKTINIQLVFNHIIILYNVFNDAATPLLYFKTNPENWVILNTFIYHLGKNTGDADIRLDYTIISFLEKNRNG